MFLAQRTHAGTTSGRGRSHGGDPALDQPPTVPLAVLSAPVVQGDARRYSGNWHEAIAEEQRAQRERQEREAAEQEAKALENYHGPRWWEGERV